MWHKTDWDKAREDPASVALPREDWIHLHDAEMHAEAVFDKIFSHFHPKDVQTRGKQEDLPIVEHAEAVEPIST